MVEADVTLSSGHTMPTLGLGVYMNEECAEACQVALQNGYRMIDGARYYENEVQVAVGVKKSGIKRENVFITSKVIHTDFTYDGTTAALKDSIANLGSSYYDLYLTHSPIGGKEARLSAYKALLDGKASGLIRSVGVSNYSAKHIEEIREAGLEMPVVNQIELHPFCQQKPIVEYCIKHNIIVQAYSPLVRGAFDNPVIQELSAKYSKDPAQILVRWSLQRGFVPLPKSSQPERIISNGQVYGWNIETADMEKLDALDRGTEGAITWNPVDAD
ncbi:NADP-dependent oxidoreductase domain-containing protein [Suillus clintonianus]|uniref:NADP-dependent oxidoreductase domain-containing protein n=1 Tax=Suillus clintonianus TaxID=1904413 RepID=UPI001B87069A|nr:NADP-dependent oxidoreductase domain-containing protein [Suillus clintonianus]KAG2148945.1 NADP-dependent oxidoreductase domain-containing protein [Suillus clintonianus]